ncbi:MAG: trypsin-like serine protease, partial [Gaiellales bacterium]
MRLAHEIPHPRLLTLTLCALAAAAFYVAVPPHANAKPARHQARPQLVEEPSVAGIINGASVTDAAWSARWQSAVGIWSDDWLMCGGTLIDAQTVVTAAHCTFDESNRALTAQHMRISIGRVEHSVAGGDMIQVERIVRHPRFDRPRVRNDIAILRLTRAPASGVSYATVEPVSRADSMWWQLGQGWATSGDLVGPFIAGWGTTTPRGRDATPRLREAKVPVASDQSCGASSAPGLGRDFDP